MCGIAGIFSFANNGYWVEEELLVNMRDEMRHRGPDGGGVYISKDQSVGLAHRRLSIIDLSDAAGQPMQDISGRYSLTYNGEIYNHAEIRKELEEIRPRSWVTSHSDTEVLLQAYIEWGVECVEKFRGMFAFAIWDNQERELCLVRDRIGIKPLYYAIRDGRIFFASEIKALLADPTQKREVNEKALYHYLSFLTTPAPDTLFAGIHKLGNGCFLKIKEGGEIQEKRYWDVWDHAAPIDGSDEEIAERVLEELRTSVAYRKVGDVPMGVFLSGGIDSSANTALFAEGGGKVKTFSIGYEGEYDTYKNELDYARMMANQVGAQYHEQLLTIDDLLDFLPEMVRLQDEPIADPVCVPVYYVSKLARDNGVTVCQVGEGADELFRGYRNWPYMMKLQTLASLPIPAFFKKAGIPLANAYFGKDSFAPEYLRRSALNQPVFWSGAESFSEGHKRHLLSSDYLAKHKGLSSYEAIDPIRKRFEEKAWEQSSLNWMSTVDLNLRLPELLLMRVDKMSMGVSLEGRVPFLDHKFVELAMSIPTEVKIRDGQLKAVLKRAVRGLIPDELIDRRKQGFGVPVYEWFFERLGESAKKEILEFCSETNYFDKEAVLELFTKKKAQKIWYLMNLALWWKHYIKNH
ncbi:asparagine synthase (glutamine-hydrolyzing) [bacterium]|nr:asparagine synthase (glutamine-hydrolyzing) [bacterium]MDB4576952.1 asparagine synthase (glutamine-hydrolyzing) [Akkermansiaceae bacterium]